MKASLSLTRDRAGLSFITSQRHFCRYYTEVVVRLLSINTQSFFVLIALAMARSNTDINSLSLALREEVREDSLEERRDSSSSPSSSFSGLGNILRAQAEKSRPCLSNQNAAGNFLTQIFPESNFPRFFPSQPLILFFFIFLLPEQQPQPGEVSRPSLVRSQGLGGKIMEDVARRILPIKTLGLLHTHL